MKRFGFRKTVDYLRLGSLILCVAFLCSFWGGFVAKGDETAAAANEFAYTEAGSYSALDGRTFAILKTNYKNNGSMVALTSAVNQNDRNRLQGVWVNELESGKLTAVSAANGTTPVDTAITRWTFEHVADNQFYIVSDDGKYLTIDGDNLRATDTPQAIEVVPIFKNSIVPTDQVYLRAVTNGKAYNVNFKNQSNRVDFKGSTATDANSQLTLYAESEPVDAIYARKISVCDIQDGQDVVIYRKVWNEALQKNEEYVVDGNGNLVYAYDEGGLIAYRSGTPTVWKVIEHLDEVTGEPNGYYDFYNEATGKYLAPKMDSVLSESTLGVVLSGKEQNRYTSSIEGWDEDEWVWCGLALDVENGALVPGYGPLSTEFSFADPGTQEINTLHEVETVDSASKGITIRMYDFASRPMMNLFNNDNFVKMQPQTGLVQKQLGSDGLPVSRTGTSFAQIYNDSNFVGTANHLFLAGTYGTTGYYEFSSFDNFAQYDRETGNFTVYEEQATPRSSGVGGSNSSYARGNYLPYNNIDPDRLAQNTKLFDHGDDTTGWTPIEDPYYDGPLYLLKEDADYFFGTIIDADFMQSRNGLDDDGDPIIYEFSGDDDLWVFLDGVLVLDIGGIHSALDGYINFNTGKVVVAGSETTIKQCFKDAGVFPDGSPWNDALVSEYFEGDTFVDFSGHSMKMIYQERGAGASTLKVRFNLPVVKAGSFAVEKQVLGTDQTDYASVQFAYQAFLDLDSGEKVPLYPGIILDENGHVVPEDSATQAQKDNRVTVKYEGRGSDVHFFNEQHIGDYTYDHVFYLRGGEAAVFSGIPENVKYYVQEIDVSGAFYETVMINDANMGGEEGVLPEDSVITAISSSKTIKMRQRVLFENKCSPKNLRELRATKVVENPLDDGATFEFRIMLEGRDGELVPYRRGDYYLVKPDDDGVDHYYKYVGGSLTDQGTEPVVCSKSGNNGKIDGIPNGYSVVLKSLLAGTDFFVEETRQPLGYLQTARSLVDGTYDPADLDGALGKIKLGKDAQVNINNHRYSTIQANKVWQNCNDVTRHGDIRLALYDAATQTRLSDGDISVINDVVQTLSSPQTVATWYIDLPAGKTLSDYAVYEETASGERATTLLTVTGEMIVDPQTSEEAASDSVYDVSYQVGEQTQVDTSADGSRIFMRTDTIFNAKQQGVALRIEGLKVIDMGRGEEVAPGDQQFEFRIVPINGAPFVVDGQEGLESYTTRNDADGKFAFTLQFSSEDLAGADEANFEYAITEIPGEQTYYVYDGQTFTAHVTLSMVNGKLNVTAYYTTDKPESEADEGA